MCWLGWRQVSGVSVAWMLHAFLVKVILWMLGIPSAVPFLEILSYAGYPFVPICISAALGAGLGMSVRSARQCYLACSPGKRSFHLHLLACVRFVISCSRVPATLRRLLSAAPGRWAWRLSWGYGSLCMAVLPRADAQAHHFPRVETIPWVLFHPSS